MIEVPSFERQKTNLLRVSEEKLDEVLQSPHGMFFYLKEENPDHILISGTRANLVGTVLYGFEHLGRDTYASDLASQLALSELQIIRTIGKLNPIIHQVFGLKIERSRDSDGRYTGKIRITTTDDALQASQAYCKKLKKIHRDYITTLRSFRNNGGDLRGLMEGVDNSDTLLELVEVLQPALPAATPVEAA